ncbi:MAG TPA: response regulator [Terriglobales bacterium]|jgi:CheY-like chemotaxis protein|nr:response regulator [Terriglobales bacterium]
MSATEELILLVDDDVTGRTVRKLMLELHHHRVLAVGEAEEALDTLRTEPVDLVILDYFLDGITGTELARQMRKLKSYIPILLLSGSGEIPHGTEYVDKYLCKLEPVDIIEKTIADLLHRDVAEVDQAIASISGRRAPQRQAIPALAEMDASNS